MNMAPADWNSLEWEVTNEDVKTVLTAQQGHSASRAGSNGTPLLQAIRYQFTQCGGSPGTPVRTDDVARFWGLIAEDDLRRRCGSSLSVQDKQAVALRVAQVMHDMDLTETGSVSIEEWTHYMLLASSPCAYAAQQVNPLLVKALEQNKSVLRELLRLFEAADKSKRGFLSIADIAAAYKAKLWHTRAGPEGRRKPLTDAEVDEADHEQLATNIVQEMDITGDEHITYHEFMCFHLGRTKHEVLIHLYDISKGAAENISPYLIGQKVEAVWHTGVVCYGKEYYFTKDLVCADAGQTGFKDPKYIQHGGYTLWRRDELHEFIVSELRPVFQRDTYDVVAHNCNHFSDRLCMWLFGKHCPKEVLQQPDLLLRSRSVRMIRPLLNYWLRDFVVARPPGTVSASGERLKQNDQPALGSLVLIHTAPDMPDAPPVLAQVCTADAGRTCIATGSSIGNRPIVGFEGAACGCTSIWCGPPCTVSLANGFSDKQPTLLEGVWVQYYEMSPSSCQGRLRTECVSHARLSTGSFSGVNGEKVYAEALKALGESRHQL